MIRQPRSTRAATALVAVVSIALAGCAGGSPAASLDAASMTAPPSGSSAAAGGPSPSMTALPSSTPGPTPEPRPSTLAIHVDSTADLVRAAEASLARDTVRFSIRAIVERSTASGANRVFTGSGQLAFDQPRRIRATWDYGGSLGTVEMIVNGHDVFLRTDQLALPPGTWQLVDLTSGTQRAKDLSSSATFVAANQLAVLDVLGVTGTPRIDDGPTIGGEPTRHAVVDIDLASIRGRLPSDFLPLVDEQIAELKYFAKRDTLEAEVWVGTSSGLIRRTLLRVPISPYRGGGYTATTYELRDYGAPMELDLPTHTVPLATPGPS